MTTFHSDKPTRREVRGLFLHIRHLLGSTHRSMGTERDNMDESLKGRKEVELSKRRLLSKILYRGIYFPSFTEFLKFKICHR